VKGINQSRRQVWLRTGEGNEAIKETEETQRRALQDWRETFTPAVPKLKNAAAQFEI